MKKVIPCPKCQKPQDFVEWKSLNVTLNPEAGFTVTFVAVVVGKLSKTTALDVGNDKLLLVVATEIVFCR